MHGYTQTNFVCKMSGAHTDMVHALINYVILYIQNINIIININLINSILIRKLNLFINSIQIIIMGININFLNLKGIYKNIYIILEGISNIINIYIIKNICNELLLSIL